MDGGPIQEGETVPQSERLYESQTNPQILNHEGAYVNKLDDMKRLQRFLVIGVEKTYYTHEKELQRQNAECVERLISNGKGVEVVSTIKEISISRRYIRQNALLLAYAICARSNDPETKRAAYAILSEICRIPTHLFLFIKNCEEVGTATGTGWGRAHKRAISSWYTQFKRDPEKLVYLITKYKRRYKWEHKDVLRLSHPRTDDPIIRFIFQYISNGFDVTFENSEMPEGNQTRFDEIKQMIKVFHEAAKCKDVPTLCSMIQEHALTWEHCNRKLLNQREVWSALLHNLPVEALMRNLGRMTSYGLFADNSEDEQMALNKINAVNIPRDVSGQEPIEEPMEGDDTDSLDDDRPWRLRNSCRNFLNPMTIFFAWMNYSTGKQGRDRLKRQKNGIKMITKALKWEKNERITKALEEAFYRGCQVIEPTNKFFYLAISAGPSMSSLRYNRSVKYTWAAAAMMMLTAKRERNCIIKACGKRMEEISSTDDLKKVEQEVERNARNEMKKPQTDCAEPIKDAIDMQMKNIDVFVIFTDCETGGGNVHTQVALQQYREYAANPDVKMVVCGMCATDLTIADKDDANMLDLVGFDVNTPWIISEFARGRL